MASTRSIRCGRSCESPRASLERSSLRSGWILDPATVVTGRCRNAAVGWAGATAGSTNSCWCRPKSSFIARIPLNGSVRIKAGERSCLSLAYVKGDPGIILPLGGAAAERVDRTVVWWRSWTDACSYGGPHREAVLRSAVTLKLLSFALSGAIIAAPTTSLPEAIGGERNWDYRYCWLRDAGLTMAALTELGFHDEARAFLSWLLHATRLTWPKLCVLYDVYGRTNLAEQCLEQLEGYRRSRPVRIGNGAYTQLQLDAYGQVVLAAHAFHAGGGRLERSEEHTSELQSPVHL